MEKERRDRRSMKWLPVLIIGIAVGLFIAEAVFGILSPVERNGRLFGKRMGELSAMASGDEVTLSDITPFAWDTVYSFDPYTTKEEMEKVLGFKSRHLKEAVSEGMVQLVFVKAGEVVCCVCGYRDNLGYSVDLGNWGQELPYRRVLAGFDHFVLEKEQGTISLVLREDTFEGSIEELYDSETALIKIDDSWEIRSSGDRVTVLLSGQQRESAAVGDRVRVTYDGMVMETYPLQLANHRVVLVKPGSGEDAKIDFADFPFGEIRWVTITSGHTGNSVSVQDKEEIRKILDFLGNVKGTGRMSGKGYYEGSYSVALYGADAGQPVCSIGFGDQAVFYYGENEEDKGYPNRYELDGMTIEEVMGFFEEYLPLA